MRKVSNAFCLWLTLLLVTRLGNANDLLNQLRASNKATLDSIRTVTGRMTVESLVSPVGQQGTFVADFWQQGDSWKVRSETNGVINESVKHDFMRKAVALPSQPSSGTKATFTIGAATVDQAHPRFNVYGKGLLTLCGPRGWPLTLDSILEKGSTVQGVSETKFKGRTCALLKLKMKMDDGGTGEFEIWFDKELNYLARKLVGNFATSRDGKSMVVQRESEVAEFAECAPGIFFPHIAETKFLEDGILTQHDIARFDNVSVNKQLPATVFDLKIPPFATVRDSLNNIKYEADANGNRGGTVVPLGRTPGIPATPRQTETRHEGIGLSRILLYGLVAALVIASGAWYVRRFRASG